MTRILLVRVRRQHSNTWVVLLPKPKSLRRCFFLPLRFLSRVGGVVCPCFVYLYSLREETKENVCRFVVTFPPPTKRLNHDAKLVFCDALHSDVEKTPRKRTKKRIFASCFSSLEIVVGRRRRRRSDDDDETTDIDDDDDERKISKVLPRRRGSVVPVHVAKLTGKVPHVRRTRDTVRERNNVAR